MKKIISQIGSKTSHLRNLLKNKVNLVSVELNELPMYWCSVYSSCPVNKLTHVMRGIIGNSSFLAQGFTIRTETGLSLSFKIYDDLNFSTMEDDLNVWKI